ncbi:nuclear transport factor 2 family protein [Rhizobium leguminosarum]|uniref:nuclear transport factor 2 family protein n=1 Tax=Rhizobium leguminosarum TaxID=384 RepID=UPI001031CE22|nr:nuclear transport factor 2 family protein [Rhizobium leguminosarum]TBE53009.1 nuclear transport factor 2 family protein [Rhizobium leguminosarum]UIJ86918.1 nuclear transport factor 2 family protein [Rhizobium leguminosarum]
MTPEALWNRYAAIWSLDADAREPEMRACLADEVTYCDPNGAIAGRAGLSAYMAGFKESMPGGRFKILSVLHHNDRSLARWALRHEDERVLQTGTSFGAISDGRFGAITGFFDLLAEQHHD